MSLDVRITWSAAFAAVGNTQPRGAESKQRRRRSSDAAVCSAMSIHAPRRDMVALCVCESTDASDVASARNAGSHGRPGQKRRCRTLQHAQRGVYRKAELRAADRVYRWRRAGFCCDTTRADPHDKTHIYFPSQHLCFKIKAQRQLQTDGLEQNTGYRPQFVVGSRTNAYLGSIELYTGLAGCPTKQNHDA